MLSQQVRDLFEAMPESTESPKIKLSRKKPGAKPNPLYDQAWEKIKAGRDQDDVYAWFLGESDTRYEDKGTRDAFLKAMEYRKRKETESAKD
jgi:hypothetical protein